MAATAAAFSALYDKDRFPAEFQSRTFGPYAAATLTAANNPLMILDRISDIESITLRNTTVTTEATSTIRFYVAPSGTAPGSGTAITDTMTLIQLTNNTPFNIPLDQTNSPHLNVAAGSVLSFTIGTATATAAAGLLISVRYKTHSHRTDDGGHKQFVFGQNAVG